MTITLVTLGGAVVYHTSQYTLDEMLELERQFSAYGAVLFCPADHAHEEAELEYRVAPATAMIIRELESLSVACRKCGRQMDASPATSDAGRVETSIFYSQSLSMRQHRLRLELRANLEALRKERNARRRLLRDLRKVKGNAPTPACSISEFSE